MAEAPLACTPYTFRPGRRSRATVSAPTACEPPPTAITIASSDSACSTTSSESVAAPARTWGVFEEWTSRSPRSRTRRSATSTASS